MHKDLSSALDLLDKISPASDSMWFATIMGAPKNHCASRRDEVENAMRALFPAPVSGNIAVGCLFYRPNRQRLDTDNMLKHVCDGATGIAWHDDSQVTAIMGITELCPQDPRTIVVIAKHSSSLVRDRGETRTCLQCGGQFLKNTSKPQIMCSRACQVEAQRGRNRSGRKHEHLPCVSCGSKTSKPSATRCRNCWKSRSLGKEAV